MSSVPVHCSLTLKLQLLQAFNKSFPEIFEQRSVDLLEALLSAGIHADVELSQGLHVPDGLRKLCVGHQEAGHLLLVQELDKLVYLRVHDGLPHQRQGAVLHRHALSQLVGQHARNAFKLIDHLPVVVHGALEDELS